MSLHAIDTKKLDGPANIAERLRALADAIDSGKKRAKTVLVIVDDGEEEIEHYCFGYRPRKSETVGMHEFAKNLILYRKSEGFDL